MTDQPKRRRGRPPLPPGASRARETELRVRASRDEIERWTAAAGGRGELGRWVRAQLDNAAHAREEVMCPGCGGAGTWETECCSGAGGCSCRGQPIDMGTCRVCGGRGRVREGEYDPRANINAIEGRFYIGSGPQRRGEW